MGTERQDGTDGADQSSLRLLNLNRPQPLLQSQPANQPQRPWLQAVPEQVQASPLPLVCLA
jgi:hypothetical protein